MTSALVQSKEIQRYLDRISGLDNEAGNPRLKKIARRIVADLFATLDELDVAPEEFWQAISFLQRAAPEFGLIVPGLGFEHFLDVRMDIKERAAGLQEGTPRTIEGPLYVSGAPLSKGFARLDDGTDKGETLIVRGLVRGTDGTVIPRAVVDVWHADTKGNYSHFDPAQSKYNYRRRIEADAAGRYQLRTMIPSGYSVPPNGPTDLLLKAVGRHGSRPAHIHFFVSAPGYKHLTTQINLPGDPYLHDDFAFATRDTLIAKVLRRNESAVVGAERVDAPFAEIAFDFVLPKAHGADERPLERARVAALD